MKLLSVIAEKISIITKSPTVNANEIDLYDKENSYICQVSDSADGFIYYELDSTDKGRSLEHAVIYRVNKKELKRALSYREVSNLYDRVASETSSVMGASPEIGQDVCDTIKKDFWKNWRIAPLNFTTNILWRAMNLAGYGCTVGTTWQIALPIAALCATTDFAYQIITSENESCMGAVADWWYDSDGEQWKNQRGFWRTMRMSAMFGVAPFAWTYGLENWGGILGAGAGNALSFGGLSFVSQAWDRFWHKGKNISLVKVPLAVAARCFGDGAAWAATSSANIFTKLAPIEKAKEIAQCIGAGVVDTVTLGSSTGLAYPAAGFPLSLGAHISKSCSDKSAKSDLKKNLLTKGVKHSSTVGNFKQLTDSPYGRRKFDRHLPPDRGSLNSEPPSQDSSCPNCCP